MLKMMHYKLAVGLAILGFEFKNSVRQWIQFAV
jgi:hypothetical protein